MYVNIHMSPYKRTSIYLYSIHSKFARLNYYMNIQMHRVIQAYLGFQNKYHGEVSTTKSSRTSTIGKLVPRKTIS